MKRFPGEAECCSVLSDLQEQILDNLVNFAWGKQGKICLPESLPCFNSH